MENVLATTTAFPLERTKPLVKDFFDRDAEIVNHLKLRMVHFPHAVEKINKLYTSNDGLTHKYRVNWYGDIDCQITTIKKIVASQYVSVITNKEGQVISFDVR